MKIKVTATTMYKNGHVNLKAIGFDVDGWHESLDDGDWDKCESLESIYIEIETLSELKDFLKKHDTACVLTVEDDVLNLEIYNDYRE